MKHLKMAMLIMYVFVLIIFGSLTSNYCNKDINACKSIESLNCNDYAYYISTSTGVQKISKCEYDTNCLNIKVIGFTLKLNDSLSDVINKLKCNIITSYKIDDMTVYECGASPLFEHCQIVDYGNGCLRIGVPYIFDSFWQIIWISK